MNSGLAREPVRPIDGLFREPAEVRRERWQIVAQKGVDAQIGFGHRTAAVLVGDLRRRGAAGAEMLEGDASGLAEDRFDARRQSGGIERVGQVESIAVEDCPM